MLCHVRGVNAALHPLFKDVEIVGVQATQQLCLFDEFKTLGEMELLLYAIASVSQKPSALRGNMVAVVETVVTVIVTQSRRDSRYYF